MIGLKIKNNFLEKTLLDLFPGEAEVWKSGRKYKAVFVDLPEEQLNVFKKQEKSPLIGLGIKTTSYYFPLPLKINELKSLLAGIYKDYDSAFYHWDAIHHCLKHKKTKEIIQLTEKEAAIIDYLKDCPHRKATKEDLLKHVWNYKQDAETHTVESTLYTLRRKLKRGEELISSTPKGYRLV